MRKKLAEKMLAVVLTAAMVASVAACGNDDGGSSQESVSQQESSKEESSAPEASGAEESGAEGGEETDGEVQGEDDSPFAQYTKDEAAEDLGGYEFHIVDFGGEGRWGLGDGTSENDLLKYSIIEDIQNKFNCTITVQHEEPGNIFDNAQPAVMGGDKYADLIGTTQAMFGPLLQAGLLLDLSTVDSIDLSADYWNQNVIDVATFEGGTYGINATWADDFGNEGVIFYNTRIWDEVTDENAYDLVKSGDWTWDKLLEFAKLAARDEDADGKIDSDADRYGIVGPHGGIAEHMVGGMGEYFVTKNADNSVTLGLTSDIASEKLNFIYDFFWNESGVVCPTDNDYMDRFTAGGALFMCYGNAANDQLRNMEDDFGVLPVPKWDASQKEYINSVDANTPIFCMTNTNTNSHEAGVILSALARRFQVFENGTLNERADTFWRLEETEEIMRDYIAGHAGYDIINLVKNSGDPFGFPTGRLWETVHNHTYTDIPSEMKAMEEEVNIALVEYFSVLKK